MLQRVTGAVYAGALAVPDGKDAIHLALLLALPLLGAQYRCRRKILVDRGEELDVGLVQEAARAPQFLVVGAQR